ncbi:gliding motility protein SprC [Flavobacterium gelatinilyticum]|uniref:gliding motility protein SprC n=1 Tax=Flavobacterium gelatinilyticum TaxID=3003260 RepID=UPI002480A170|nr:gliding motility protein SprC [Flavobacterium gelatinilyticum]
MIQKTTLSFLKVLILFSIFIFTKSNGYAQTIVPQQLGYPRICAGLIVDGVPFNEYNATFSYVDFPAGTSFEVELSDDAGNFTSPVSTTTISITDNPTLQQQTIRFAVPTDLKGSETHSLRIKSLTAVPVYSTKFRNSQNVNTFPVYYRTFVESFYINNKSATATYCGGGSFTFSVDNPTPADQPSSPANYPNLKYKWFKDEVVITGETGPTLTVNAAGVYYAQIDYGGCLDENFSSNRVTLSSSSAGSAVTISSSLGNPFCSDGAGTVLTATNGNSYVWKKDGEVIAGASTRSISAAESGIYTVEVDFGGCKASGSINLQTNSFNASIDVADQYELKKDETLNVSITSDATTPKFQWYLNNIAIQGANTANYTVSVRGLYRVVISQESGCVSSKEFTFRVTSEEDAKTTVIQNIVKLSGAYPFWNIPDIYKTPTTKIMILSSNGDMLFDDVGSNYDPELNSFIQDFKNVNPVYYYVIKSDTGEKKGSITVIK